MDQPQNTEGGAPTPAPVTGGTNTPNPESNRTLMGVLAYIGPLVLIPYFTAKEDPFVKFHIKQGLVLLVIEAALWVIGNMVWMLYPVIGIVNIGLLVLSIIGIINVVQKKEAELPLLGKFASHFNF
jgi:uncharacterized membrane protein